MAKTEWGMKRACQGCGSRFYDLGKSLAPCPHCGTIFDPEAAAKNRRRAAPLPSKEVEKPFLDVLIDDGIDAEVFAEPDNLMEIEDASDLVEEDDVPTVLHQNDRDSL